MKDEAVNDGQVRSDVNDFLLGSLLGNTNIVSLVYKTRDAIYVLDNIKEH